MHRFLTIAAVIGAMAVAIVPTTGRADQGKPNVTLTMTAAQVVVSDGHKTTKPISGTLQHGDVVRYEIVAKNIGSADAIGLKPSAKIPYGTVYVANSATLQSGSPAFSVDGKTFSTTPTVFAVVHGKKVKSPASIVSYRLIRWTAKSNLAPNAVAVFDYDVKVQ